MQALTEFRIQVQNGITSVYRHSPDHFQAVICDNPRLKEYSQRIADIAHLGKLEQLDVSLLLDIHRALGGGIQLTLPQGIIPEMEQSITVDGSIESKTQMVKALSEMIEHQRLRKGMSNLHASRVTKESIALFEKISRKSLSSGFQVVRLFKVLMTLGGSIKIGLRLGESDNPHTLEIPVDFKELQSGFAPRQLRKALAEFCARQEFTVDVLTDRFGLPTSLAKHIVAGWDYKMSLMGYLETISKIHHRKAVLTFSTFPKGN